MISITMGKGQKMCGVKRTLIVLMLGAFSLSPVSVYAQTEDIAIYDNQTNDFLLPSYFDAEPDVTVQEPQVPQETPQDVPTDIDILTEIFGEQAIPSTLNAPLNDPPSTPAPGKNVQTRVFYPTPKSVAHSQQKQPLLTPLAPLPEAADPNPPAPRNPYVPSTYASQLLDKESGEATTNLPLPQDIRLQFLPNRTQLTATVLKWVKAYALHVRKDPRLVVTLRVSYKDWAVQQARLSLIMQILFENGLSARQLQILQSDRDPDTLVIGWDKNPNLTQVLDPEELKRTQKELDDDQDIRKEQKILSW